MYVKGDGGSVWQRAPGCPSILCVRCSGCCSSNLTQIETNITHQFQQNSLVCGFYVGTQTGFITEMWWEPELSSIMMLRTDGHLHSCSLQPHRWVCGAFLHPNLLHPCYLLADNQPTADFIQPEAVVRWEPGGWLALGKHPSSLWHRTQPLAGTALHHANTSISHFTSAMQTLTACSSP